MQELRFKGVEDPQEVEREDLKVWFPRVLGIAPLAILAYGLLRQGGQARGAGMVITLLALCILLLFFYTVISYASLRRTIRFEQQLHRQEQPLLDKLYEQLQRFRRDDWGYTPCSWILKLCFGFFRALTKSPYPFKAVDLYYTHPGHGIESGYFDPVQNLRSYYLDYGRVDRDSLAIKIDHAEVKPLDTRKNDGKFVFSPTNKNGGTICLPYIVSWRQRTSTDGADTHQSTEHDSASIHIEMPSAAGAGDPERRPTETQQTSAISSFQKVQDWLYQNFEKVLMEPSKYIASYLLKIRVQVTIVAIMAFLFEQSQVKDVLLAMVLDQGPQNQLHFAMATSMGVMLSILLWHTTRLLTRLFPQIEKVRKKASSLSLMRQGVFSHEVELLLFWMAWISLALCTIPIAKEAFQEESGWGWWHYVGMPALLYIAGAILIFLWRRLDRPYSTWSGPFQRWFYILLGLGFLLPFLFGIWINNAALIPSLMGSVAMLFWGLSLILVVSFTIYQFSIITSFPMLSLLLISAYFWNLNRINDNHSIRLLSSANSTTTSQSSETINRHLPSLENVFIGWLLQRQEEINQNGNKPYPIYVVSAQGGGIYAAYHSAKALAVLTEEVPSFHEHIFAISGVSGGSVGATVYANALRTQEPWSPLRLSERIERYFDNKVDRLALILSSMLFGDTTQRLLPWPVPAWDRSLGLELGFENRRAGGNNPIELGESFYKSQDPEYNPNYTQPSSRKARQATTQTMAAPYLVLNTTEVRNGRRFILSPFRIPPQIFPFEDTAGNSNGLASANLTDADFHEPWLQQPQQMKAHDIRFSTAAAMSARFPIVSPYGFFPESKMRRLIDGGLYDNSGAITAYEIIETLTRIQAKYADLDPSKLPTSERVMAESTKNLLKKVKFHPIAIVDDKAVNLDSSYAELENQAQQKNFQWLGWSAIDAVFSTREARIQKAVDLLSRFDRGAQGQPSPPRRVLLRKEFRLAGEPRPIFSIPLGWKLSCQARAFINDQIQPLPKPQKNLPAQVPWNADGSQYTRLPCELQGGERLAIQRVPVQTQTPDPLRKIGRGSTTQGLSQTNNASLSRPFWWLIQQLKNDLDPGPTPTPGG